jgi:hypothetical protein
MSDTPTEKPAKKPGRRINSSTEQIRQAAAALRLFTRKQLRDTGFSQNQVSTALDTLLRQGRVKRTCPGAYEFVPERKSAHQAPLEDRIWHAMRINPSWSCSDIAVQAGTTISYVYKRLREYRAEQLVRRAGQRLVPGGAERLWRLTGKGREHLTRPAVQMFEPDREVLLALNLAKLVATGMAKRYADARAAAVSHCNELIRLLEGLDGEGTQV